MTTALTRLVEMGFARDAARQRSRRPRTTRFLRSSLLTPDAGAPAPRKRKRLVKQRDAPADDDDDELDERAFERKPSRPRKAPAAAEPEIVITGVETWAQCELCSQWRRLAAAPKENEIWTCKQNPDAKYAKCSEPQELPDDEIDRRMEFLEKLRETKGDAAVPSTEPPAAAKSHDGRTTPPLATSPAKAAKAAPAAAASSGAGYKIGKVVKGASASASASGGGGGGGRRRRDDGSDAEEGGAAGRRSCRPAGGGGGQGAETVHAARLV